MSSVMDTTHKNMVAMRSSIGQLEKLLRDNLVVAGKAEMTALKALVDALNTLVQACAQSAGSDFNTLP